MLGHSPIPLSKVYTNQGTWGGDTYSDMTYYTDPHSGAGILDTGNNNWINAMGTCPRTGCAPRASSQKITGNILWLFGQGPAGRTAPVALQPRVDPAARLASQRAARRVAAT